MNNPSRFFNMFKVILAFLIVSTSLALDVCIEVTLGCDIEDENGMLISCDEFMTNSIFTKSTCERNFNLSVEVTHIFDQALAVSYMIDSGTVDSNTFNLAVGQSIDGKYSRTVDLCNNEIGSEIKVFDVQIVSAYRPNGSLIYCEESRTTITLTVPETTESASSSRPSINSSGSPSSLSSSSPSINSSGNTSVPPSQQPSTYVTHAPSIVNSLISPSHQPSINKSDSPSKSIDDCIKLTTECLVEDENGVFISCDNINNVNSNSERTSSTCLRNAEVLMFAENRFDQLLVLSYVENGSDRVTTGIVQVGSSSGIKFFKEIDLCNTGDNGAVDVLDVLVKAVYRPDDGESVICKEIRKIVTLAAPITIPPSIIASSMPSSQPTSPTKSSGEINDTLSPTANNELDCFSEAKNSKGKGGQSVTHAISMSPSRKKDIKGGKGIKVKSSKGTKATKGTKAPKKCEKSNKTTTTCKGKKMGKVKIPVQEAATQSLIHFGAELYINSDVSQDTSLIIVDGLNDFYKGGLLGCDKALQDTFKDAGIVSLDFKMMQFAGKDEVFDGLESLCQNIPDEYRNSKCYAAGGSVEIYRLLETRRRLNDKDNDLYQLIELILSSYGGSFFNDDYVDIDVAGLSYSSFSPHAHPLVPVSSADPASKWKWSLPTFALFAFIASMSILVLHREGRRRLRHVTTNESDEERDTDTLFRSHEKYRSDINFPLSPIENDAANKERKEVESVEDIYDYDQICPVASTNDDDETAMQQRQLLREYTIPTLAQNVIE